MSDDTPAIDVNDFAVTSADGTATNATGGVSGVPAGTATGTPPAAPPVHAPNQPAADPPVRTVDQSAALADLTERLAKLEEARSQRPPSTLDQLQAQIDQLTGVKNDALGAKVTARDVADRADDSVADLRNELRQMKLRDAATAAGVPADRVPFVASAVAGVDGDPETVVGELVKAQPWLAAKVAPPVPDVTRNQATNLEPGIAELAADIAKRNPR